jgi:hypothetical protein
MSTTKPAPLKPVSLTELFATDMPKRSQLLSPWLREQESCLVWAAAGVGKTMFTLSLALGIAGGGSLMGWSSPRPRRVLLIDGEMPLDDLQERLRMLAGTVEGVDIQAAGTNLTVLARHGQSPDAIFPDFGKEEEQDANLALVRSYNPDVVILDNLSTLATVANENDTAEVQKVVKFLARLKQARVGCIVVHHANKGGQQFRGNTMLATTFEVIIGLKRDKSGDVLDTSGTTRFHLEWTKFRGRRDPSVGDRAVHLADREGRLTWVSERPEDEVLEALASLIRTSRYRTQAEVGQALPSHLWPNENQPSTGWISKQFKRLKARPDIIRSGEITAHYEAAGEEPQDDDDEL